MDVGLLQTPLSGDKVVVSVSGCFPVPSKPGKLGMLGGHALQPLTSLGVPEGC